MLFNSAQFIFFFPIVVIVFFYTRPKYRWILLLVASYYFYMSWNPKYLLLIVTSTLITYLSGLLMNKTNHQSKKTFYLVMSLILNLLILFGFKYLNFSIEFINSIMDIFDSQIRLQKYNYLLPVGISFYTFQALSYSLDVYKGRIKPERHFGIYALYVSFFPQLVAGPIERSEKLLPQFRYKINFDYVRVTDGLKLMLWGYYKKVVVAERLAIIVNNVYNDMTHSSSITLIIATVFFGIQIYCDFSAYSDIAIGAAKIMGFNLMDNFKRPYYSKTISEFWQRWHISLSTWFRDYLYIPLGGNRVSQFRYYLNILITFVVSGLWHGAKLTFVIWGGIHGLYIIISNLTKSARNELASKIGIAHDTYIHKVFRVLTVFILVNFAWIFFRANSLNDALFIIGGIFKNWDNTLTLHSLKSSLKQLGISRFDFLISVVSIVILEAFHMIQRHRSIRSMLKVKPIWFRWLIYYSLTIYILLFGVFDTNQFIYFQF